MTFKRDKDNPVDRTKPSCKKWREYGSCLFTSARRDDFINLIKADNTLVTAAAHIKVSETAVYERMEREWELADEYTKAKEYMNILTGQVIHESIKKGSNVPQKDKGKLAMDWKKLRDKRFRSQHGLSDPDGKALIPATIAVTITDDIEEKKEEE